MAAIAAILEVPIITIFAIFNLQAALILPKSFESTDLSIQDGKIKKDFCFLFLALVAIFSLEWTM